MSFIARSTSSICAHYPAVSGNISSRCFSASSSSSSSSRQVLIQLTEDIEGLGQRSDRILVNPGRARNSLIPSGKARFVPWKRPAERLAIRISPIIVNSTTDSLSSSSSSSSENTDQIALQSKLNAVPNSLIFQHRTISPTSETIYGSVALSDITKKLEESGHLTSKDLEVINLKWIIPEQGERVKMLGSWKVEVGMKGLEDTREIGIEVVRLE